jgi:hypothetical protein
LAASCPNPALSEPIGNIAAFGAEPDHGTWETR